MGIVFDLIIVATILGFAAYGYFKGFVAVMEKLLYFVVVATLAVILRPMGVAVLESTPLPKAIETKTEAVITEAFGDRLGQKVDEQQLREVLSSDVLPEAVADMIVDRLAAAGQLLSQESQVLISNVAEAIADFVVAAIALIALYVILSIAYFFAFRALGLVVKLPLLKQADRILGVAGGLISGLFFAMIVLGILTIIAPFSPVLSGKLTGSYLYEIYLKIM